MSDAWRNSRFDSNDQEPLGPLANLIDIMLVFACGLIAALVAVSPDLKQHFQVKPSNSSTQVSAINESEHSVNRQAVTSMGKELIKPPKSIEQQIQADNGYQAMGQVYKDPKTGKLILIKRKDAN